MLETSRLVLRELCPADQAGILALYSNPEVSRVSEMATLANPGQAARVLDAFQAEFKNGVGIRWAIILRETNRLAGVCGIGWYPLNRSALFSYDLNQDYWNRGLMTEAGLAVVKRTFEQTDTNRITATTVVDNLRSMRVLQKLGFQEEGTLRDWAFWKGEFKDLRCFSLLRRDFQSPAKH